ncbi:TonB-dependent receptor domain-containing protein [Moraxella bovis]|uniref:TonB-dependent receptor n=1 Tax=Moraxella bovis TaxID=476 RepID=A0A1T0A7C5_MORBO|nr:TonB-dependent receptor [Moraxella bovis]AWY20767.1 TonB-dependent receptor [Moraxella bovis]OOR91231.1 outer membrane colicin Js receptor [Moraxella bovis]UYZ69266.1 TonB-dependent receptor [Moraxella bovis]UYZ71639.1 TonB-dependent receptor [Moraxella bovis]UYZ72446.1 TonB-dependent receptor [Moraxella bovis]
MSTSPIVFQKTKLALCLSVVFCVTAYADNELVLEEVTISAKQTINKKPFTTSQAITSIDKETIDRSVTGLDSVVRSTAGAFTSMDTPQGTLNVNVRGMTGFGRVNTMIDGVPQTLFGVTATSEGEGGFHTSPPSSSTFGAVIDSNFLVGADISRGGQGGSHGTNALMGSVNFRTIGVDDIIQDDKNWGVLNKYTYGTNKLGHNAMLAGAVKGELSAGGSLGIMLATSGANKSTDYKRGDGKLASHNDYVISKVQKPRSYLAKLEYQPSDMHSFILSGRDYRTNIGGRQLNNNAYGVDYYFTPDNRLVDLAFKANTTATTQSMNRTAKYQTLENAVAKNRSNYFDLSNISRFDGNFGKLTSRYGVSFLTNDYSRTAVADNEDSYNYTPFSPTGKQTIKSVYMDNTFEKGRFGMDLSLTYADSEFEGFKPACGTEGGVQVPCFPIGEAVVSNRSKDVNGKIALSYQVTDWFMPFVSYARTSRMPNIQEVFFNNQGGGSMNPFLKPEKADIKEVGFNIFKHGILADSDTFGLKATYFHSKIKDYIHAQTFYLRTDGKLTNDINDDIVGFNAPISVNSLEPVTSKGVELMANYDTGRYFANLSYTHAKSDQPVNINSGHHDFGFTGGGTDRLPTDYWTAEVGTRAFNNKLSLSAQVNYYGKNARLNPDYISLTGEEQLQKMPKNPIITNLFAHYQVNQDLTLRAGIENVFDKLYIHPLNSQNSNYSQLDDNGEPTLFTNYARGRTATIGLEYRF